MHECICSGGRTGPTPCHVLTWRCQERPAVHRRIALLLDLFRTRSRLHTGRPATRSRVTETADGGTRTRRCPLVTLPSRWAGGQGLPSSHATCVAPFSGSQAAARFLRGTAEAFLQLHRKPAATGRGRAQSAGRPVETVEHARRPFAVGGRAARPWPWTVVVIASGIARQIKKKCCGTAVGTSRALPGFRSWFDPTNEIVVSQIFGSN